MAEAKVFVGSLSWDTDDRSLKNYFEKFGRVSEASVATDRETGRSRGFGKNSYIMSSKSGVSYISWGSIVILKATCCILE